MTSQPRPHRTAWHRGAGHVLRRCDNAANMVEAGQNVPLAYPGLQDSKRIAIEYGDFGDERLAVSIMAAESAVGWLVECMSEDLR